MHINPCVQEFLFSLLGYFGRALGGSFQTSHHKHTLFWATRSPEGSGEDQNRVGPRRAKNHRPLMTLRLPKKPPPPAPTALHLRPASGLFPASFSAWRVLTSSVRCSEWGATPRHATETEVCGSGREMPRSLAVHDAPLHRSPSGPATVF